MNELNRIMGSIGVRVSGDKTIEVDPDEAFKAESTNDELFLIVGAWRNEETNKSEGYEMIAVNLSFKSANDYIVFKQMVCDRLSEDMSRALDVKDIIISNIINLTIL